MVLKLLERFVQKGKKLSLLDFLKHYLLKQNFYPGKNNVK